MWLGEALSHIPPLAGIWQELRQGTDVWVRAGSGRERVGETQRERKREGGRARRREGKGKQEGNLARQTKKGNNF